MNEMNDHQAQETHRVRRPGGRALLAAGLSTFAIGLSSCETPDVSGIGSALDVVSPHVGGYLPSEAQQVVSAYRALRAIAEYQASEKQLAEARRKAKRTGSTETQYIRVKPDRQSRPKTSGKKETHVVAYNPKTDKLDDEVVVVADDNVKRGDSVRINGNSGKII